jgi:D-lactate dehydrogenase
MKKPKISLFDAKPYDMDSFDAINRDFGFQLKYYKNHLNLDTVKLAEGSDVVCPFVNDPITAEVIQQLLKYRIPLIALRSAGYNNVDLSAAYRNIHVVRVPAYSPYAIAEHTVALIMALNRKTHRAFYRIRDNNFTITGLKGFDMYGKTAGVIGTGKIGKVLINILKGFGMHILAYDVFPDEKYAEQVGFKYVSLDDLYRNSDIISLNCPLNKSTYHLINQESITKMKDGVMIINTGRGHLIDTKALIEGLKKNKIGAAGLDVYEEESEFFFEDFSNQIIDDDVLARLMTFGNVLITSHQGFFTQEALENIARTTLQNVKDHFEDKPLINEICYRCNEDECRKNKLGRCF